MLDPKIVIQIAIRSICVVQSMQSNSGLGQYKYHVGVGNPRVSALGELIDRGSLLVLLPPMPGTSVSYECR